MLISLVLAILPYCTPQANPEPCIEWMLNCLDDDLSNEEVCIESIDIRLLPQ